MIVIVIVTMLVFVIAFVITFLRPELRPHPFRLRYRRSLLLWWRRVRHQEMPFVSVKNHCDCHGHDSHCHRHCRRRPLYHQQEKKKKKSISGYVN